MIKETVFGLKTFDQKYVELGNQPKKEKEIKRFVRKMKSRDEKDIGLFVTYDFELTIKDLNEF